jgi:hypothetical protein
VAVVGDRVRVNVSLGSIASIEPWANDFRSIPDRQTLQKPSWASHLGHQPKSFDLSITSSVYSYEPKHPGFTSRGRAVLVPPQYRTNRIFWAPVFGLTGKTKRNLINVLKESFW